MEETHSSQVRERNNSTSLSYENQRRDALRELVPNVVRQRLTFHLDECWFVHFSPSAQYLASAGLDFSVILWQDVMVILSTYTLLPFLFSFLHSVCWLNDHNNCCPHIGFGFAFGFFHILFCPSFLLTLFSPFHCCFYFYRLVYPSVCLFAEKRPYLWSKNPGGAR
jgi:WD40 repeat protein